MLYIVRRFYFDVITFLYNVIHSPAFIFCSEDSRSPEFIFDVMTIDIVIYIVRRLYFVLIMVYLIIQHSPARIYIVRLLKAVL